MTAADKAIIVVGAGGHGKVVADIAATAGYEVLGFVDDAPIESPLQGLPLLGSIGDLTVLAADRPFQLVIGIGDNDTRKKIAEDLSSAGFRFAVVVAPSAVVSRYAVIDRGTVILPGAVVNAGTRVGAHVILNTGCVVDHDCEIQDYAHVSPSASLSGNVTVGQGSHIGTGASVIPGKTIGAWSVVGAGAVVTRDVGSNVVAVGVPAVERPR